MSRSRKKRAIFKGGGMGTTTEAKGFANRKVRNFEGDIPDGNWYRKIFNQYDIHDFRYDQDWKPYIHMGWGFREPTWIYPDPKWKIYSK